jgi:hypothetical protein
VGQGLVLGEFNAFTLGGTEVGRVLLLSVHDQGAFLRQLKS